jgi:hypothetical protein
MLKVPRADPLHFLFSNVAVNLAGSTPGWTRDKRRIQAGPQRGPETKHSRRELSNPHGILGERSALPRYRDGMPAAAIIMMRRRLTRLVAGQYVRTEAATSPR